MWQKYWQPRDTGTTTAGLTLYLNTAGKLMAIFIGSGLKPAAIGGISSALT